MFLFALACAFICLSPFSEAPALSFFIFSTVSTQAFCSSLSVMSSGRLPPITFTTVEGTSDNIFNAAPIPTLSIKTATRFSVMLESSSTAKLDIIS